MSDFHAANLHKKVDHIMDVFFGAGVASHPTIIEQINYLLFMRALSQNDDDLRNIGITDDDQIVFDGELEKYRWDNLLTLNAEQLFIALEECFRKIPESTTNKTVRLVFRNAHIKLFDKPTLRTVVHEVDDFARIMDDEEHQGKRDIFGDTYEYLLSKLAQAGTSGQFRTPRHIIEFLVAVIAPKKGETIIDPAVGTAGFLVKAFEYLRQEYTSPEQLASGGAFDKLSSREHTFLYEHTFSGFDSDEDMIKFGMMNLYLHGLQNARMIRQNTLTDTAGSRDKYDVILANPPFSGKIDRDSVAEELQMGTGATEVLFLRYMMRHMTDNGRAGVIVPEGVLFNASGAHTKIRELLLEHGLWCVVSLPGGVFNPYAGVKTSVLFFDKTRKEKSEVLFAKVEHDGFSLSAQRRPIAKNDLPELLEDIERYKNGEELQLTNTHIVGYDRIKNTKDSNLSGDRYKFTISEATQNYPIVKLSEVCDINPESSDPAKLWGNDKDFYYLDISSVQNNLGGYHLTSTLSTSEAPSRARRIVRNYDVLLSTVRPNLRAFTMLKDLPERVLASTGFAVLRAREGILPSYLYHISVSDFTLQQMTSVMEKGSYPSVTQKDIEGVEIPLPPLEIQQKIVDEIENKQKAIDHSREIILALDRERISFDPSTRASRENWPVVRLSDVAGLVRGPFGGSLKKEIFVPSGFKVYEQGDAIHGNHQNTRYFVDKEKFDEMSRFRVATGDLIMSCSGTLGRIAIIEDSSPEGIINQALLKITPNEKITSEYMKLALESRSMQAIFALNSQGGVINNVVSVKQLAELKIPLPPHEVQMQIVAEFAEQDKWIEAARSTIGFMEESIKTILANI